MALAAIVRHCFYLGRVREHGHVICDVPGCGAIVPAGSPILESWETLSGANAPDADLCPRCVEKRERARRIDRSARIVVRTLPPHSGRRRWALVGRAR
jgi:hypothetical protein